MAVRSRRMFTRRPRQRLNGHWTGFNDDDVLTAGTAFTYLLWDQSTSEFVNANGKLRPRRIIIHLGLSPTGVASSLSLVRWYVTKFQTDLAQAPASGLIVSPQPVDADLMENRMLTIGQIRMRQPASVANGAPYVNENVTIDLSPRGFSFDAQQEVLAMVIEAQAAGGDVDINGQFRTYCSWV